MTMEEFRNVEVSPESIEIGVEKHKTADDYGNAGNIISHQVYKWLKLYLVARNQRVLKSDVVFVTWNGKSLTSSNISDRIHIQWARAGIWKNDNMWLNTSLIRKSTTTDLVDKGSVYAKDAACLMMHSEKTAKEHYQLVQKKQSMHRESKAISGLYFPEGVIASDTAENEDTSTHVNSTCVTPRKVWNQSELELLSNIPGSPNIVARSPEVATIRASRCQIYDKVRSMKESTSKVDNITSLPTTKFRLK